MKRQYTQGERARSTADTADRILDAALALFAAGPVERIRLDEVAERSGVTVQTVIRRFGGKGAVITAMAERELGRIAATRQRQQGAEPEAVLHALVLHYERYGDLIVKMYAEAAGVEGLSELAARGRAYHVGWCHEAFAPTLAAVTERSERRRRSAQLVALCDATTWRILRREQGLSRPQAELALTELITPLIQASAR